MKMMENNNIAGQPAPSSKDKNEVAKFQTWAQKQGWYTGRVDGMWGPLSQAAWDKWCESQNGVAAQTQSGGDVAGQPAPFSQDKMSVGKFQTYARQQGWYKGRIDGLWGPLSQAAWDIWCNQNKQQ